MRRYVATTLAGLALVLFTGVGQAQTSQSRQSQYPSQRQTTRSASRQGQEQIGQGTQFYLGSGTIRQIQQKLKQDGENISQADGRWSSRTSDALKTFQQKNQLPATGDVDLATLTALDITSCPMGQSGMQTSRSGARTPLYVGYRTLQQVHDKLQSSGMNPGSKVAWDSQTQKAVRQFQQQQGLDPTGQVDFETLCALNLAQNLHQVAMIGEQGANVARRNRTR